VDHLALEVREIDVVVVEDPKRAHAGGCEIERGGRAEASGAQQQHLGVEQLLLSLQSDLWAQQVARVALALLGGQSARYGYLIAEVLPQRDPTAHRLDVFVAALLGQRPRAVRGAIA